MFDSIVSELRPEILVRLGLSLLAGVLLGIEREQHGRAAGLRTTLLVTLAACVAMIISDSFYMHSLAETGTVPAWHPDPARLAAGALSGMGFLGAGVIIRQTDHLIRGVTTAATLWFATVVGLSFGAGAIGIGLVAMLLALFILVLIPFLEDLIPNDWYSDVSIQLDATVTSVTDLIKEIERFDIRVKSVDLKEDAGTREQETVLHLKFKKRDLIRFPVEVVTKLCSLPGVKKAHWLG